MYICLVDFFFFGSSLFPQVCVQVVSPCESSLSWEIKCESVCFHIVVLLKLCYHFVSSLRKIVSTHRKFATITLSMLLLSTSWPFLFCWLFSILRWKKTTIKSHQQLIFFYHVSIRNFELCKFYLCFNPCPLYVNWDLLSNASLNIFSTMSSSCERWHFWLIPVLYCSSTLYRPT